MSDLGFDFVLDEFAFSDVATAEITLRRLTLWLHDPEKDERGRRRGFTAQEQQSLDDASMGAGMIPSLASFRPKYHKFSGGTEEKTLDQEKSNEGETICRTSNYK